jgi:hypothetical protein
MREFDVRNKGRSAATGLAQLAGARDCFPFIIFRRLPFLWFLVISGVLLCFRKSNHPFRWQSRHRSHHRVMVTTLIGDDTNKAIHCPAQETNRGHKYDQPDGQHDEQAMSTHHLDNTDTHPHPRPHSTDTYTALL